MMEMVMEEDGCLWTFVLLVCISIGMVMEIVYVIICKKIPGMRSILIMIILRG